MSTFKSVSQIRLPVPCSTFQRDLLLHWSCHVVVAVTAVSPSGPTDSGYTPPFGGFTQRWPGTGTYTTTHPQLAVSSQSCTPDVYPQTPPGHRHLPATDTSRPQTPPGHRHLPATDTSRPQTPPGHRHLPATDTSRPQTPPGHRHLPATDTSRSQTPPGHRHLPATDTSRSQDMSLCRGNMAVDKCFLKKNCFNNGFC